MVILTQEEINLKRKYLKLDNKNITQINKEINILPKIKEHFKNLDLEKYIISEFYGGEEYNIDCFFIYIKINLEKTYIGNYNIDLDDNEEEFILDSKWK